MKEMNRREFLALTGAAVVALSLAGCGGAAAPAAPAGSGHLASFGVQRYCKSKTIQNKKGTFFIFIVEMQRTLSKGNANFR